MASKLAIEVGKNLRATYGLGGSRYTQTVDALTAWADIVAWKVQEVVPKLSYEGYWVSAGHAMDPRVKVKGPGVKFITMRTRVPRLPGWHFTSHSTLKNVAVAFGFSPKGFELPPNVHKLELPHQVDINHVLNEIRNIICNHLQSTLGVQVVLALEAAVAAADRSVAEEQVRKNLAKSDVGARKAAIRRLGVEMEAYDFTEDDVIEAWRDSQVRRVQES